ncbi:MAG: transcriptional regulator of arginine metabolism [Clostridia bacterium]|nr:transcriptional regulator of arginine metabolism [Clostridia bacterium]MDN5323069.1 transcriptional regulator of arginine metabolism [Clostridia bacterium]
MLFIGGEVSELKTKRHKKILELIQNQIISTQEEVAEALRKEGFNVTQATVSRDIKELGLIKVAIGNEMYKYALPMEVTVSESRLKFMIKEFVLKYDYSENIIVIKTPPGNAQAVASVIDNAQWREVIGTVAGDDTILLVIKPVSAVPTVIKKINSYLD